MISNGTNVTSMTHMCNVSARKETELTKTKVKNIRKNIRRRYESKKIEYKALFFMK